MRWRYAALSGALVIAAISYSVYWFRLAAEVKDGVARWAEARRAEGVVLEYSGLAVSGFPLRVQAQAADVRFAGDGWEWKSPLLSGHVLPYRVGHIVLSATLPQEITLQKQGEAAKKYWLTPDVAVASLVFDDGKLARLAVDITGGEIHGDAFKGTATLGRAQLHARTGNASIDNPPLLELAIDIEKLIYPGYAGSALGEKLDAVHLNLTVEGAAPDTYSYAGARQWRDAGGIVQVADAQVNWGPLDLAAAGTVALDAQDRLIGALTARLRGYDGLITGLRAAGQLNKEEAVAARLTLGLIARAAGDANGDLSLPLLMQDGEMMLGPVRLARLKPLF